MSVYISARGAGRSGPIFPRTVSIYSNNYRKLHGMNMMRNVHLRKIRRKRYKMEYKKLLLDILESYQVIRAARESYSFTYDLPTFDHESESDIISRKYLLYGQPVLNNKAVVKIVTSEDKKDEQLIN